MGRRRVIEAVAQAIVRRLAQGEWEPPTAFPPVRRLAEILGVSNKSTIAALRIVAAQGLLHVEQRKPITVTPGAAEAARDLLCRPSRVARTRRLALLFPEFWMPPQRNAFYSSLINAVTNEAASRGIQVQLVPWSVRSQIEVADSLTAQGFEAAVIIDFQQGYTAALYRMLERGQTFMIFNIRLPGLPLPSVVFDLDAASRQIAARLANLGHRNLCLMLHPHDFNKESERGLPRNQGKGSGWLRCLGEKGLLETCSRPLYMPWEPMLGLFSRDFRALLKSKDRPTAIVFGHSPWARAFLNDPEFSGFNVPGDLSLATFESTVNMPHVPWCPPLTSIDINYSRTAQCIMETMEKLLAGNDDIPSIRVPLDIRITESIGPAPGCRF